MSKQLAVDEMNARFIGAASACGAPAANLPSAQAALQSACKPPPPADRSLRFVPLSEDELTCLAKGLIWGTAGWMLVAGVTRLLLWVYDIPGNYTAFGKI